MSGTQRPRRPRRQRGSMAAAANRGAPATPPAAPPAPGGRPTAAWTGAEERPAAPAPAPGTPPPRSSAPAAAAELAADAAAPTTGVRESRNPVVRSKPRLRPVKCTFELDPEQLRRVKKWAGRRVLSVAAVVRALFAELTDAQSPTGERIAARLRADAARPRRRADAGPPTPVKTTFDVEPGLYGDLQDWITDHDTTAVATLRALFAELLADRGLAARIEARAAAD